MLLVKIQKRQEAGNGACVESRIRFANEWMRGMVWKTKGHVKATAMFQKRQKGIKSRDRLENLPVTKRKDTSNLERETKTCRVNGQSNLQERGRGCCFIASSSLD